MTRRYTKVEGLTELVRTRHEQGETYAEITPDHIRDHPKNCVNHQAGVE